jgi:hypothetical protein
MPIVGKAMGEIDCTALLGRGRRGRFIRRRIGSSVGT